MLRTRPARRRCDRPRASEGIQGWHHMGVGSMDHGLLAADMRQAERWAHASAPPFAVCMMPRWAAETGGVSWGIASTRGIHADSYTNRYACWLAASKVLTCRTFCYQALVTARRRGYPTRCDSAMVWTRRLPYRFQVYDDDGGHHHQPQQHGQQHQRQEISRLVQTW